MKKILFILALVMGAVAMMAEEPVKVTTIDGMVTNGTFIEGNDSTITIKCTDNTVIEEYGTNILIFPLNTIENVKLYGKVLAPYNGRLVPIEMLKENQKKQPTQVAKPTEEPVIDEQTTNQMVYQLASKAATDQPKIIYKIDAYTQEYMIGKALKTTGDVSMAVGIPCLVAGTVCMITAHAMPINFTNDLVNATRLESASYYLFPIGAALTIVGIPLHVHGKKIMTMNFNYTGNGVGVGLEF